MVKFFSRKASIQKKLFISYLAVLLSLVLVTGLLTVTVLQNILHREMLELKQRSVEQMKDKVQLITDHILAVSNIYYINTDITKALTRDTAPGSYEWYNELNAFNELFSQYDFAFDWLDYSTSIIAYNGKEFHSFTNSNSIDDSRLLMQTIKKQPWYQNLLDDEGRVIWLTSLGIENLLDAEFTKSFYAVRELHSMYTGQSIGVLIIGVDIKSFDSRLYQGSVQDDEIVYILDNKSRVVSSSNNRTQDTQLEGITFKELSRDTAGFSSFSYNGEIYQAIWDITPVTNWLILSLVKDKNLFRIIYLSKRFLLLILFFCFISASLVALTMASHFSKPIQQLAADMKKVEDGDLSIRSSLISLDEIGNLAHRFNSMLDKTIELMDRNMSISQMKQKAELEALQRQVNPHFIYNSLGTIRFMLKLETAQEAEKAIIALNKMLRYTLSGDDSLVLFSQEIDMTVNYLSIARKQLKESLELNLVIPDEIKNNYIPKLILQPLVENSIFHGIKPTGQKGIIRISAKQSEGQLIIKVKDNGIGFPFESLEDYRYLKRNQSLDDRHNGIGILNIHDRIVLRFGSKYGLKILEKNEIRIGIPLCSAPFEGD